MMAIGKTAFDKVEFSKMSFDKVGGHGQANPWRTNLGLGVQNGFLALKLLSENLSANVGSLHESLLVSLRKIHRELVKTLYIAS